MQTSLVHSCLKQNNLAAHPALRAVFLALASFLSCATPAQLHADAGAPPAVLADLTALQEKMARKDRPIVWVITGDSITQGAKWLGTERAYPELIQERVRWSLKRYRDLFINSGVSGERSAGLLADFDWRVLHFHPDVVSIMIGMNSAVAGMDGRKPFESDLREMIRLVRAAGAIPIINRTNPTILEGPDALKRVDLPTYNEIIARVAGELHVILVDHWSHWQEAKPTPAVLREWMADPLHPNGAGHRQFAIEFFRAIGCYDQAAPECRP